MAPSLCRTTLTSHLGLPPGDRSFLQVRERLGKTHTSECLTLHGAFDVLLHESLHRTLLGLSHSALPLVIDLRGICALDEGFLVRLLKAQRETASIRPVSFQIADDGPVLLLIQRLGLEERFGLEPSKRLPKQIIPTLRQTGQTKTSQTKTSQTKTSQTRRTQWATNENH